MADIAADMIGMASRVSSIEKMMRERSVGAMAVSSMATMPIPSGDHLPSEYLPSLFLYEAVGGEVDIIPPVVESADISASFDVDYSANTVSLKRTGIFHLSLKFEANVSANALSSGAADSVKITVQKNGIDLLQAQLDTDNVLSDVPGIPVIIMRAASESDFALENGDVLSFVLDIVDSSAYTTLIAWLYAKMVAPCVIP